MRDHLDPRTASPGLSPIAVPSTCRALVVAPTDVQVATIRRHLGDAGFSATISRVDLRDTLRAALAKGGWDVVIVEDDVPTCSARAALEVRRDTAPGVPLVVVARNSNPDQTAELASLGAAAVVQRSQLHDLGPVVYRARREAIARAAQPPR